ncbi:MAG: sulfurtransferase [Betaproteobacteria bacterium]
MYTDLISATQLQDLLSSGTPYRVFDCSFDLAQDGAGEALYTQSHIPGAVYADLDTALSAKGDRLRSGAASGGRHPLPARETFAQWLAAAGFRNGMQAVVYDRHGSNFCGRLWWMLKWLGHAPVALLNGGFQAWIAQGGATESGPALGFSAAAPDTFSVATPLLDLVDIGQVERRLGGTQQVLIDARAPARFKGDVEPLDPVAGHIPGAFNRPFSLNFNADGTFKPAAQLRTEFDALLGLLAASAVVHHCGSGVSAIPNIVAMQIAGLPPGALFAGSWSEWCVDPARPVARG